MLYVDAIRILEKIAQARFLHATMPKQEEIEEAIGNRPHPVQARKCPPKENKQKGAENGKVQHHVVRH